MENKRRKTILEGSVKSYDIEDFNTKVFEKLKIEKQKTIERIQKPRKVFADSIIFLLVFITSAFTGIFLIQGGNLLALSFAISGVLIILYMVLSNIFINVK